MVNGDYHAEWCKERHDRLERRCDERHDGIDRRLGEVKGEVSQLWVKWDEMNSKLIGALVALVLQLAGIIFLIIRTSL